ncbi:MAG TPA: 2-oxo-4-hydroxy-4-carboxy-5-ureidoimidazoline decarboxylase [Hyphomonadaceae bacterium]|nr:2-oxo-4-hydroxy-4-carboxy-5-ureidoimidazoline decarboxylase [Hyphomonadaceae bacterium]
MGRAIEHIRALDKAGFVDLLGPLYEHSPWAAERAFAVGPFDDVEAVGASLRAAVDMASEAEKLQLIRAHPVLAGEKLRAKALTHSSMSEQASRGLDHLGEDELQRWAALNAAYREKFGFPFVICVRLHSKDEIVSAMERRLNRTEAEERTEAVRQIHDIARLRLEDLAAKLEAQS